MLRVHGMVMRRGHHSIKWPEQLAGKYLEWFRIICIHAFCVVESHEFVSQLRGQIIDIVRVTVILLVRGAARIS